MRFSIVFLFFVFISCSSEKENDLPVIETNVTQHITEPENKSVNGSNTGITQGEYLEYYPGGELKIKGFHNENIQREGLWISYYEEGNKWSESYYVDGKKDGHSLTFYPNGNVRYIGEYKNDEKIGDWTFYDENGVITHEEKY